MARSFHISQWCENIRWSALDGISAMIFLSVLGRFWLSFVCVPFTLVPVVRMIYYYSFSMHNTSESIWVFCPRDTLASLVFIIWLLLKPTTLLVVWELWLWSSIRFCPSTSLADCVKSWIGQAVISDSTYQHGGRQYKRFANMYFYFSLFSVVSGGAYCLISVILVQNILRAYTFIFHIPFISCI